MAYTALEKMRKINREKYGIDGPVVPPKRENLSGNLEREVLSFIREDCRDLLFLEDDSHLALSDTDGKSTGPNQIPYNMERDIDRLCLERAIHNFFLTGNAEDAFDVYFVFLEMFVGDYRNSQKMIELLSEFEMNTSTMLMDHRDHYSHSVYVFALGLAIYKNSDVLRSAYEKYYELSLEEAPKHFLKYWGFASLFHDIGYPFELPFAQVKAYFKDTIEGVPFVSFKGLESYVRLDKEAVKNMLPKEYEGLAKGISTDYVFARELSRKLEGRYSDFPGFIKFLEKKENKGKTYCDYLESEILSNKAVAPDAFGGYMDHAYFSATVLFKQLSEILTEENKNPVFLDALTAILLHNSMYKFSITNIKNDDYNPSHKFLLEIHPLAYVLMLCDELQCWDRTSYGQNSRQTYHPMWCEFNFENNKITADYWYDDKFSKDKQNTGTFKKMKSDGVNKTKFLKDIEDIISINGDGEIKLEVKATIKKKERRNYSFLSSSSFLHLYNFALAICSQYEARHYDSKEWIDLTEEEMENNFDKLSIEYKMSNIAQAKAFSKYLNELGYFYTDREVDFPMIDSFNGEELNKIGHMEHDRWNNEKAEMGWIYGVDFIKEAKKLGVDKKIIREQTRTHDDLFVEFKKLTLTEQQKDIDPMNDMIKLLSHYDGVRIYSLK